MLQIFLDTETTGTDPAKHRIVEIAYKVFDTQLKRFVLAYETIISQSLDVWAEADPVSVEINQLSYEKTLLGKEEKVVAAEIANDLNHLELATKGGVFICQNPASDRPFFSQLISATLQNKYRWPYHWLDLASMYYYKRVFEDPNVLKSLKESDLSKNRIADFFKLPKEKDPHRAMNGVDHLIACYEKVLNFSF